MQLVKWLVSQAVSQSSSPMLCTFSTDFTGFWTLYDFLSSLVCDHLSLLDCVSTSVCHASRQDDVCL